MKLDEFINKLSWKKIIFSMFCIVFTMNVFSELFMASAFNNTGNAISQVIDTENQNMEKTHERFIENDKKVDAAFEKAFVEAHALMNNDTDPQPISSNGRN